MLNKKPIKIGILEASPQTKAILEFFFSSSGKSIFKESSIKDASAFIIDYDYPGSKESWEKISAETKKPGIIISIKKVEIESSFWVPKPLNSKDLIETGNKIREILKEAEEKQAISKPVPQVKEKVVTIEEKPVVVEEIKAETTEKEIDSTIQKKTKEKKVVTEEPTKQKVKAELALASTDNAQPSSLDFSENENFEDFSLEERTSLDSKDVAKPTETFDLIDEFSPVTDDAVDIEETTVLPKESFTTNSEPELIESISDTPDFAISPTLIEVVDTLDESPVSDESKLNDAPESNPTSTEQASEEGDIDSLLQTLISGETGKQKTTTITETELPVFESLSENKPEDTLTPAIETIEENEFSIILSTIDNDSNLIKPVESGLLDFTVNSTVAIDEPEKNDSSTLEENTPSTDEFIETNLNEELIDLNLSSPPDEEDIIAPLELVEEKPADLISLEENIVDLASEPLLSKDVIEISLEDQPKNETKDLSPEFSLAEENTGLSLETQPQNPTVDLLPEPIAEEVVPANIAFKTPLEEESDLIEVDNNAFNPDDEIPFIKSEGSSADFESVSPTPEEELKSAEDELQSLLDEIRGEAEAAAIKKEAVENGALRQDLAAAKARWDLICGNNPIISKPKEAKKITFDPNDYMISALLNVCEQSRYSDQIMRLKIKDQLYVVDYNRDFVYHDNSIFSRQYAENCQETIEPTDLKIHNLDVSEQRLYLQKVANEPDFCHNIEPFIWTTSLLTSHGRLPTGTDVNKTISLKSWPNLTRLEQIPNDMQIAAIFYKHPGSLMEISNWLKIEQRYIFAFYNASLSLDLIELDEQKIRSSSKNAKKASKKTKNRGFFSRLLKRLKS